VSSLWRSARNIFVKRILHADDSPRRIALGVAIGVLIGLTPTMGAQTIIAIALAALLRANKAVVVPVVWITNPFTFVPIYGFCWWIGSLITGSTGSNVGPVLDRLQEGGQGTLSGLFSYSFWAEMFDLMVAMGAELWIGCLLLGTVGGGIMYFVTLRMVVTYRARREARLERSRQRRTERRNAKAAKLLAATDAA
jgi:uncharacterized protein (DUF2062 family)